MSRHIIITIIAAFVTIGGAHAATVAPDSTGMTMNAHDFSRSVVMGWNLGNALESAGADWNNATQKWTNTWVTDYNEWETGWGNPKTTKEMIMAVKKAGFNAIRIPVRWVPHVTSYSTMAVDPTWMARVRQVVDWCLDLDMIVILNTHHEKWLELNPLYSKQDANLRKLKMLWTNIANEFRDYDQRLVFAGTNEVIDDWSLAPNAEKQAVQNSYNQTFVSAVRATGGRNYYRNLVIQTYACSPGYGLSGLTFPEDPVKDRLSIEFHYYDPYNYCSGDIENGCYYYWGSQYSSYGSTPPGDDERKMRNLFAQIRNAWYEKGYGVVIGEYGVSHHVDSKATAAIKARQEENESYYVQTLVSEARKNGFAAFVWDNNTFGNGTEKFGIFDRHSKMAISESARNLIEGISKGSTTEFQELTYTDTDPGANGTVFWSGDKALNWGIGLQLNIPASKFTAGKDSVVIVFYYRQDPSATYDQIQVCNSAWAKLPFHVDGGQTDGDFSPRNYYGTVLGDRITAFCFKGTSLSAAKNGGIHVQGYGVNLTKVSIVTTFTGIDNITTAGTPLIYRLDGTVTSTPEPGNIYIKEGKKILWK